MKTSIAILVACLAISASAKVLLSSDFISKNDVSDVGSDDTVESSTIPDDHTTITTEKPDDNTTTPTEKPDDDTTTSTEKPDDDTTTSTVKPDDNTTTGAASISITTFLVILSAISTRL